MIDMDKIHYARTSARLVANIVDNILISLLTMFIVVILTFTSFDILNWTNFVEMLQTDPYSLDSSAQTPYELVQGMLFFVVSLSVLYGILSLGYFQALLAGKERATFGMRLFKLKLVPLGESTLTPIKIFIRNIIFLVAKAIYIGSLSIITMAVTKNHQALHDMVVDTTVIFKD